MTDKFANRGYLRALGTLVLLTGLTACGGGADLPAQGGPDDTPAATRRALAQPAAADSAQVVRTWNELAFQTARAENLSDALAARTYAMLNAAIYDAVNGIDSQLGVQRNAALVPGTGAPRNGDLAAAATAAAHAVLSGLFPGRKLSLYDPQRATDLAAVADGTAKTEGEAWGDSVGQAIVGLRSGDVPPGTDNTLAGNSDVGRWQDTWTGTRFRALQPFVIATATAYTQAVPPALASAAYAAAFNDVKLVGDGRIADPLALATYRFWADGGSTPQPPGKWLQAALQLGAAQQLPLNETARLVALVSLAMADTVPVTYTLKHTHHTWRPLTAIRRAAEDGNPDTAADLEWVARATGTSPDFVSGHSTFAGAGSTALRGYFCNDNLAFTLEAEASTGLPARSYASFTQAEAEAGRSRVLGGIHFEFSNQAGLAAGRGVGQEVLDKALLRTHGATHIGGCPK
jgi:hypothetical protein